MYLGIDIGTSGVKSVLVDDGQRILDSETAPLEVSRPRAGWSEQDPDDWWRATCATLDALASRRPEMKAVAGIGLSGQMHGATLLDERHRPLRPAILWNDGRSERECAILDARADFRGIGGNLVMPGFTAPKLEWVRRNEPEVFARTARVLLPKDYVRLRLVGDHVSDLSDSAGTLWLDVAGRRWSPELLEAGGLTERAMPRLAEGSEATGTVRRDLLRRWGMENAPVVAGGGGDNAATACGVGALAPGTGFASLGTSGVLFVSNARFSPHTDRAVHAFCHAAPGIWHQMAVFLSAADSLSWLAEVIGATEGELLAELGDELRPPGEVSFLPYLSGERTPHNDAGARGAFAGLSRAHGRADLVRAVLEGVAFSFRDGQDALEDAGAEIDSVFAVGGGARSRLWVRILAAAMGRTLLLPEDGDYGAAFGAARLGICAATGADPLSVCVPPAVREQVAPDAAAAEGFSAAMERYRGLYFGFRRAAT